MSPICEYVPRFITALDVRDDNGLPFTLLNPLRYVTNVDHLGTFEVPAGFKTDYASIPRVLWNVLPPVGAYDKAAVLHDHLYQTGKLHGLKVSRGEADAILREAMEVCQVSRVVRWAIYSGVRLGGWRFWRQYRKKD